MFTTLKTLKDNNTSGDFLFPSLPRKVKGTVSYLTADMVVIDSEDSGTVFQYITHPNNICIVQIRA